MNAAQLNEQIRFETSGGVSVQRDREPIAYDGAIEPFIDGLDSRRGAVFSSNYEYPGRYNPLGRRHHRSACRH